MLHGFLLLVSLVQETSPAPFLWRIEGMGNPKSLTVVTVEPTPFGLTQKLDVKTISLEPLPTDNDPKPRSIRPLKTESTARWGLRTWFAPPGRRFHITVTLSDGSTHKIDIYRSAPRSNERRIQKVRPATIAPRWT